MLTFDEFFKKKRIDLTALQQGEPSLFSEFKTHYQQMGEKSFDHTKKYWFNKIRRQFPLAPEIKSEKEPIENQLAEQTINESLTETVTPASKPKMGFVPKFKAGNMAKPVANPEDKKEEAPAAITEENIQPKLPEENTATKPAYKPRFNMKSVPPKPPEE